MEEFSKENDVFVLRNKNQDSSYIKTMSDMVFGHFRYNSGTAATQSMRDQRVQEDRFSQGFPQPIKLNYNRAPTLIIPAVPKTTNHSAPESDYHFSDQIGHLLRRAYQRHVAIFQHLLRKMVNGEPD